VLPVVSTAAVIASAALAMRRVQPTDLADQIDGEVS